MMFANGKIARPERLIITRYFQSLAGSNALRFEAFGFKAVSERVHWKNKKVIFRVTRELMG